MTKEFNWTTTTGAKAKLIASYECIMQNEILSADGDTWTGDSIPTIKSELLVLYVNNNKVDSSFSAADWILVNKKDCKKIRGLCVGFADLEIAEAYEKFITEVIVSGTSEEVIEYRKNAETKKRLKEIDEAKKLIIKAELQKEIPSYKKARQLEREYNNLYNEGCAGYVPHIIDIDEYNLAKKIIEG